MGWEWQGDVGIEQYIADLPGFAEPLKSDLLYAGKRQKTRILDRTAKGLDVNGAAFAPYNTTRPYYYYPGNKGSRASIAFLKNKSAGYGMGVKELRTVLKREVTARNRFFNKIGLKNVEGVHKTAGAGIYYPSYAAFKASLGRAGVDLTGPKAPHMLQAIQVLIREGEIVIGIYGDEAERAEKHNFGLDHMPKREFFAANDAEVSLMTDDVLEMIVQREAKRASK
jgi:hypothetical protein